MSLVSSLRVRKRTAPDEPLAKAPVEAKRATGTPSSVVVAAAVPAPPKAAVAPASPRRPRDLWRTVQYVERGVRLLSDAQRRVLAHIEEHHEVPADFEDNKARFGALSGVSFEERLLAAFQLRLLPVRAGHVWTPMCAACGAEGHLPRYCPAAFATKPAEPEAKEPEAKEDEGEDEDEVKAVASPAPKAAASSSSRAASKPAAGGRARTPPKAGSLAAWASKEARKP